MIELKKLKNINYEYPICNGELVDILLTCNKKILPILIKHYDIWNNRSIRSLFHMEYINGNSDIRRRIDLIDKICKKIY